MRGPWPWPAPKDRAHFWPTSAGHGSRKHHRRIQRTYISRLQGLIVNATRIPPGPATCHGSVASRIRMSHFGAIWEPFWVHFGTPEPFWVHFGAHLGLQEHIWAADPILGPILEPSWDHFWLQFGPKRQPKNKSQFKTLSDTILGPNFGKIIEQPLVFDGFLHISGSRARDAKLSERTPTCIQICPNMVPKLVQNWCQKWSSNCSCFLAAFRGQIESQNGPQMAPKMDPKTVGKTSSEKTPILKA